MKHGFADTGYWIALVNPGDGLDGKAIRKAHEFHSARIVATDLVVVELLNHFPVVENISGKWPRWPLKGPSPKETFG